MTALVASLGGGVLNAKPQTQPVSAPDARGHRLNLPSPPQRIVSLVPSMTESLCALGACDRLVGTDRYSNVPDSVVRLPKLGGLDDAVVERIVALKPDVVVMAPSSRVVARLESLAVPVLTLASNSHEDVKVSLEALSALLGQSVRGAQLWAQIQQQVLQARARVPVAWQGRSVFFEVDGAAYAAGPTSFIGQTLTELGLVNIFPREMGPFPKVSPEFVVRAQPDLVMGSQRSVQDMLSRPGWRALRAHAAGRVCGFSDSDYELFVRPGPRLGQAAHLVADCLHQLSTRGPR